MIDLSGYIEVKEAAKILGKTEGRVRQLCIDPVTREKLGATKVLKSKWLLNESAVRTFIIPKRGRPLSDVKKQPGF